MRARTYGWIGGMLMAVWPWTGSQAASCPADQYQLCALTCYCLPVSPEVVKQGEVILRQQGAQLAAPMLEDWIVQSRAAMPAEQLQPIPPALRQQLSAFYAADVLDTARFKVNGGQVLSSAESILQNPDINAVTLIDVIVFRSAEDAASNVALWAHELKHVEQYRDWGVHEFALRYAQDSDAVEAPAYAIQRQVAVSLQPTPLVPSSDLDVAPE
ncbi:DUF4157 domain-containing protein [Pseudomonas sp. UL073]|uniref:DUF4157 domain-containing protein n=1 Tax=Zestomonas insulae TaxID=2809017 RepID=A0ABS2I870_9GAMM|nr:DUF4157 domain-containing protein [Pseudomonas insulae]MBM7059162.1 DUF4157 domain-containing protein [Pseudomonas insulae]